MSISIDWCIGLSARTTRQMQVVVLMSLVCMFWSVLSAFSAPVLNPPHPDAVQVHCEPIRKHVISLTNYPVWTSLFVQPRVAQLKRQYSRCFENIQSQEFEFLRQAEIPGHPDPSYHHKTKPVVIVRPWWQLWRPKP